MTDRHSADVRSFNMSHIHSRDTTLEVKVRKYLFSKGFRYRKNDRRYPGKPDIVLPKYKTVIFINGCFWHMHEGCRYTVLPKSNTEFWTPKLRKNKERDARNTSMLETMGWKVITVWECELRKNVFEERMKNLCNEILKDTIEQRSAADNSDGIGG